MSKKTLFLTETQIYEKKKTIQILTPFFLKI